MPFHSRCCIRDPRREYHKAGHYLTIKLPRPFNKTCKGVCCLCDLCCSISTGNLNFFIPFVVYWLFLWHRVMCFLQFDLTENNLLQIPHLNGFNLRCTASMCLLKSNFDQNSLSHMLHLIDFSPLWVFSCLLTLLSLANEVPQILHIEDLILWCIALRCAFRLDFHVNVCEQISQENSSWLLFSVHLGRNSTDFRSTFSCTYRVCLFSDDLWVNCLLHTEQENAFSPVWTVRCAFSVPCWLNDFSHKWQENGFLCLCTPSTCILRAAFELVWILQYYKASPYCNNMTFSWLTFSAVCLTTITRQIVLCNLVTSKLMFQGI